jgi:hypothetical protein
VTPGATDRRRRPRVVSPLPHLPLWRVRIIAVLAVLGPGLVSGFADNDAGGITTYSVVGAKFGYALLWVLLASRSSVLHPGGRARLGLATGRVDGPHPGALGVRWGRSRSRCWPRTSARPSRVAASAPRSACSVPPQISAAVAAVSS